MKRQTYLIAVLIISLLGCEPDDICLEETPGTPEVIVVFYDNNNPEVKKEVPNLQVKGVDFEAIIHEGTTDSISIPLKTLLSSSSFKLSKTENSTSFEDIVTFNYNSFDRFISRACGYKTTFKNVTVNQSNITSWIKNIELLTDSISDNKSTHVKILH